MDGKRIQQYWSNEMDAMLKTYNQFQILIPSETQNSSAHKGEDGRYVESLLKSYLRRYLPKNLEVLTGFILRPAVKTGLKGKERSKDSDKHSTQLDLIIYDSSIYPIFQRLEDNVIVPPEGVIGIISVKKHLNDSDIEHECKVLKKASIMCSCKNSKGGLMRGPYLALVAMGNKITKSNPKTEEWIFKKMKDVYEKNTRFTDTLGYLGALNEFSIFKRRPTDEKKTTYKKQAKYVYFKHNKEELHMGLQFILTGILSVYYDNSRSSIYRPGFTAFISGRAHDRVLGSIETDNTN